MVSFLIGFQGFSMLFDKKPGKETVGKAGKKDYTRNMYLQAGNDLTLLQMILPGFGQSSEQGLAFQAMYMAAPSRDNVSTAYMLLQGEAKAGGYTITEGEIDQAIANMTNRGFDFEGLAARLRQNQGITLQSLKAVLGRWLVVFKCYRASNVLVPPSRVQLLNLFRDLNEKIELTTAKLSADSFLDKVAKAQPTEEQIKELFEKYKNRSAGQFSGFDSFTFGYLQEPKVQLAYLFLNQAAIERASVPPLDDIQDYYNDNKDSLLDNAGKPKSFTDAKKEIIKTLAPQAGQAKFQQVLDDVQRALRETKLANKDAGVDAKTLEEIAAKFTVPADELLERKIPLVAIENQPLEDAMITLSETGQTQPDCDLLPVGQIRKHDDRSGSEGFPGRQKYDRCPGA